MQLSNRTRYQAVSNGYEIIGSREYFNRTLYGSHDHDDSADRYFTFAGDLPLFMGAVADWTRCQWCKFAKSGVLMSGLALTPGVRAPYFYTDNIDTGSQWFHHGEDTVAVYRNGWMEYELSQFSPWFPDVKVTMTALPLLPEDGFLIHYRITTDQQVIFCAGFGGLTEDLGRFEYARVKERDFHASDCQGNTVVCKDNRALVKGPNGAAMWIGASFPVTVEPADALAMQTCPPSMFLADKTADSKTPVVKMSCPIGPGRTLDGFIVVIRNESERVLDQWLTRENPIQYIKHQVRLKTSAIVLHTPDSMLNTTVPSTVLAMDASWQKNAFYHGAYAYHAPFLGWRNWYGPTAIGWHDRVKKAVKSHFACLIRNAPGKEAVWYDGGSRPDLDHEGTQYHQIKNTTGRIPALLGHDDVYNMQEVALDMLFHHLNRQGDLKLAKDLFDDIASVLDWEERILDPDHDGLYQNFLNTWISDGHSYHGGGCAQASAYNYLANLMMAKIAQKLGRPDKVFKKRAAKILKSIGDILWIPAKGILAEFIDTMGNKLLHTSPELSTIFLAIDCDVIDPFQAYQALRFTETDLRSVRTLNRKGRLVYSSNWYPQKYSSCGLYPAENLHLALAYFKTGLKNKGLEILDAIVDSYFTGKNPGMAPHILSPHGASNLGDQDFSDVSSLYLRAMVEGLFGIRFCLLDDRIEIAPNFPDDWTQADLKVKDVSLNYYRAGQEENLTLYCEKKAKKTFKLPLRSTRIADVFLNNTPVSYTIEAGIGVCNLVVETPLTGLLHLRVIHEGQMPPTLTHPATVFADSRLVLETSGGKIIDCRDPSGALTDIAIDHNKALATVKSDSGSGPHTVFVRVSEEHYDVWLPADLQVESRTPAPKIVPLDKATARKFEPLDISAAFNCSLTQIHTLDYNSPRPKGYSIGVRLNGRYAWDWNHGGHNAVRVDDSALRRAGEKGLFRSPSGLGFLTPQTGPNVACVSLWDNFPSTLEIPLAGNALELALFLLGATNPMQSWVTNASITVVYADGSTHTENLVHQDNFDDWLNAAQQTKNETVYFSDFNHGIVHRIRLAPEKQLAKLSIEAVANEVIVGLLGLSIRKK